MSLSIAAPASFWYLKAFPIADIAKTVDYIVYMTYDLHGEAYLHLNLQGKGIGTHMHDETKADHDLMYGTGQWDFNSRWASDGCPKGSCLRSHGMDNPPPPSCPLSKMFTPPLLFIFLCMCLVPPLFLDRG
jgi:hypothetical protein